MPPAFASSILRTILGPGGERLGAAVDLLDDIDGDGFSEVVVGSPTASAGGVRSGRVSVYSGETLELLWALDGESQDLLLGSSVSNVGDVDLDGVSDFAVGAPSSIASLARVDVFSGRLLVPIRSHSSDVYPRFGAALAGGDFDGDGYSDLVVGACPIDPPGPSAVVLFSGRTGEILRTILGPALDDSRLGFAVANLGDVNHDGVDDFGFGAPLQDWPSGDDSGAVYVHSGSCGGFGSYGEGCPGRGGFVPTLQVTGCAAPGGTVEARIEKALGGSSGALFASFGPADLPLLGCRLFLQLPLFFLGSFTLQGPPGFPGEGRIDRSYRIPNAPRISGIRVHLQGFLNDSDAPRGVSMTNGFEVRID